jgi:hypothetical protein
LDVEPIATFTESSPLWNDERIQALSP